MACGYGHFINNSPALEKFALDINSDCLQYLDKDIHCSNMNAIDMKKVKTDSFDVIFTSNFFEHLSSKDELELVLDNVWEALSPNGKFLIMGPNIKYLGGDYLDFYDHHIPLTHNSLCEVLRLKGFKIDFCLKKFTVYHERKITDSSYISENLS